MSLFLGSVSLVDGLNNLAVNINDTSGNEIITDASHNLLVNVANVPTVSVSGNVYDGNNLYVNVANTVSTDVYSLLNNQRQTAQVWANVQVSQNETSASISPSLSSYCNTTLSCYGSSTEDAVIAVQFSNDTTTFYTTQYQYTLTAGDFGFSIPCSAYSIRLKLLSATTSTLIAFIDIC